MAKLDQLFTLMKQQNASDLHLSTGSPPFLRLHGEMVKLNYHNLSAEECQGLIFEILNEKQRKLFVEDWELDCSYALPGVGRFRVNVFMQRHGIGGVFRIIPEVIKTVTELGLPESLLDLVNVHKGLILVTGPTGSGKSTTLASLIHHINTTQQSHIITVEDPIEFVHNNNKCLINQREVSSHTKSFANALRAALREDPDIILVGEMRDLETISLAMTAAETGHLVFGTLHTNNAPKTIDRVIDVFPQEQQAQIRVMLSESLRGVVAQTLLPKADRQGRIACIEVLVNTHAVANLIREGKTFQIPSAMQTGRNEGMLTFETYVDQLVKRGLVSPKDGMDFLGTRKGEMADKGPKATVISSHAGVAGISNLPPGASQNTTPGVKPIIPPVKKSG
jgi:twitching motility protein PilT